MVEEEDMELKEQLEHGLQLPPSSPATHRPTPSKYSLSSGAASSHTYRGPSYSMSGSSRHKASAASSSSTTTSASELGMHRSPWQEEVGVDHQELPSINPSDLIKTLLSQLASSISAMKGAFAHLQATIRAAESSAAVPAIAAENVMVEGLQRLSDLHMRLCAVTQEGYIGAMKKEMKADKTPEGMLKSYEGLINRFYEDLRKKDAVAEALKDTLAKSMLKGEKLERRVKFLEAKLSLT